VGELPLTHSPQGDDALRQISRLHGRRVLARDGFVAHYERDGAVVMRHVTRAHATPIVRGQRSRMVKGIERGRSNVEGRFFHLKAREQMGRAELMAGLAVLDAKFEAGSSRRSNTGGSGPQKKRV
jgi:hypothetical protein